MLRLVSLLALFCGLNSSCYTLQQSLRFNNTFNGRVSVREALNDPALTADRKAKLELTLRVLEFAEFQGLNVGDSYQHIIPEAQRAVSYSVQAAEPDRFVLRTHWFPIVGSVPYIAYFDVAERDAKAAEFRAEGLDVSEGTVGAFSSLGWFADPIYPSMLQRSEPDLVLLLLHELTHRSFWSRGSASFNENLAEFVGLHLTELYLKQMDREADWKQLVEDLARQKTFRTWLIGMKSELEKVYADGNLDKSQKLALKAEIIARSTGPGFPKEILPQYAPAQKRAWNNASILGSALYLPDMDRFAKAFACSGAVTAGAFLELLKEAEADTGDAEKALVRVCELRPAPKVISHAF